MHFSSRLLRSLLLVPLLTLWLCASPASAQSPQILVVSGENVPEKLYEAVSDALGDVGSVMSPSSYSGNLRARQQEPDSEEALTKIAPQMGASLIVVLQPARNKLKVQLRDGHTGKKIKDTSVPARGKKPKLGGPARKRLVAAAKRALSKVGPAPARPSASTRVDDDFADEPTPEPPARNATGGTRPARPAAPVKQAEPEEESDDTGFEESEEASLDEAPPRDEPAAASDEGMWFPLHAGIGVGSRAIRVPTPPTRPGGNRVDTEFAPALDIGAGLALPLGTAWQLRFLANYRTVLNLNAAYLNTAGMMAVSALSSHSFIIGTSLGHVSDGRDSFGIHVFLGWAYRSMSASDVSLPSAGIQGVVLRPELEIPIANRLLTLRLAPELILVLSPSATLPANDNGLAGAIGYAFGGEASIDLHISQTIGVSLQFRESRATTPSGWGSDAIENERYFALRFLLRL